MNTPILIEICVVDVEGALAAERGGADRIELCADIAQGGTTPSVGVVATVLSQLTSSALRVMIRPRGGDFTLTALELQACLADIAAIAALPNPAGIEVGFVFGVLTPDGHLDVPAMRVLRQACGAVPCTLHKAVDSAHDLIATAGAAVELGMTAILSSGGSDTALTGAAALVAVSERLGDRAQVIVAGGVRPHNAVQVVAATGARSIHLRAPVRRHGAESSSTEVVAAVRQAVGRA